MLGMYFLRGASIFPRRLAAIAVIPKANKIASEGSGTAAAMVPFSTNELASREMIGAVRTGTEYLTGAVMVPLSTNEPASREMIGAVRTEYLSSESTPPALKFSSGADTSTSRKDRLFVAKILKDVFDCTEDPVKERSPVHSILDASVVDEKTDRLPLHATREPS